MIDAVRRVSGTAVAETIVGDARYALRLMRRAPAFTAVAILSLALGIGANTAIFSLIDTLMLRTLPVREPDRLVELLSRFPGEPRVNGFSWKVYEHFRDENRSFSDLVAVSPSRFQVRVDEGSTTEAIDGELVVGSFFSSLGVRPAIGRLIALEDDRVGAPDAAVVVLTWSFWQRRFNLDPTVVGRRLIVDGVPATIVGVAPREFFGLQVGFTPDVWMPVAVEPLIRKPSRRADGTLGMKLMGRLKPGVSIDQAAAEMRVLDRWRVEEIARTRNAPFLRQFTIEVEPAGAGFSALRDQFSKPLLVLMVVVGLLLLIACTNIASLLLARGAARQREMAVRVSLGASRLRLVRQALTESLLLSAAGSALGVVLAYAGADALVWIIASGRGFVALPQRLDLHVQPDARALLFTAAVAIATGILFGLAPAWHIFASAPASSLTEFGSAGETRSRRLFGKGLVVAQVGLSMILLTAGSLFVRHLSALRDRGGFVRDSVLLATLDPAGSGYRRNQLSGPYRALIARLEAIPGVRSATLSAVTPIEGPGAARFVNVEGHPERPEDRRYHSLNWIAPRYFETLGTPLLAGRDFQFEDEQRSRVAIVNQAMARHYFGAESPLGKHLTLDGEERPYEIVGVAGDAKYLDLHETAPQTIYLNAFQEGRIFSQFAIRTTVRPSAVAGEVRTAVNDVLKTIRIAKMTTMADQVDASIVPERLIAMLSGLFGGLGALLAALGLYGLLAFTVARRITEIGVRMALGATERRVTGMVLKDALALVSAGLVIGAPVAWWAKRFAVAVLDNVAAAAAEAHAGVEIDTFVPLALAATMTIVVGLGAAYFPARRAARVQPMEALRHT